MAAFLPPGLRKYFFESSRQLWSTCCPTGRPRRLLDLSRKSSSVSAQCTIARTKHAATSFFWGDVYSNGTG
ncbi:unnamed protein product, partial [Nesidiocoris tenuis]